MPNSVHSHRPCLAVLGAPLGRSTVFCLQCCNVAMCFSSSKMIIISRIRREQPVRLVIWLIRVWLGGWRLFAHIRQRRLVPICVRCNQTRIKVEVDELQNGVSEWELTTGRITQIRNAGGSSVSPLQKRKNIESPPPKNGPSKQPWNKWFSSGGPQRRLVTLERHVPCGMDPASIKPDSDHEALWENMSINTSSLLPRKLRVMVIAIRDVEDPCFQPSRPRRLVKCLFT